MRGPTQLGTTHRANEFVSALVYSFLGALGITFLRVPSPAITSSIHWIGELLITYGIIFIIFLLLERTAKLTIHKRYWYVYTTVLLLIVTGLIISNYGADLFKIIGGVALAIAVGRALALLVSIVKESWLTPLAHPF